MLTTRSVTVEKQTGGGGGGVPQAPRERPEVDAGEVVRWLRANGFSREAEAVERSEADRAIPR